jgi:hypothetical protein
MSKEEEADSIAGLGLKSDYQWKGEDLVEALREVYADRGCEHRARGAVQAKMSRGKELLKSD